MGLHIKFKLIWLRDILSKVLILLKIDVSMDIDLYFRTI